MSLTATNTLLNLYRVAARANSLRPGAARANAERLAALQDRTPPRPAPLPGALLERWTPTRTTVAGNPVVRLTPRGAANGRHLVYTHGGAYVHPLIRPHWHIIDRMARGTGVTVTVPLYRVAPEGDVDAGYAFLTEVYDGLVREAGARSVTLAGDSAGGGLALGLAVDLRDRGAPGPRQVVLFSPWVDLTMTHPAVPALERLDPMLRAELLVAAGALWGAGHDPLDPRLSPARADLDGLPPVHLFQGGRDVFAADVCDLAARLERAGNGGTFSLEPDGFHVYVGALWTPEARAALNTVNGLLTAAP
ncbi:alpha/beta hydrolase fold domain-containing protein [Streptomyces sp. NPDC008150]|uniref:alpha/beta hydrolase fold domain-containing protein n=1 Tax=Streptomyces sp. NPDC008150 TaxID=3364816 RepID=UPI0036E86062